VGWYHEPDTARPLIGAAVFSCPSPILPCPGHSLVSRRRADQGATTVHTRKPINLAFMPDPALNRAKRLAPRRVPSAPDSSIVFQSDCHQSHSRSLPDWV
jgi:hypothetical protein